MIDNSLTNSGSVLLVKLHFTGLIVGQIMPTKSLADTTASPITRTFNTAFSIGPPMSGSDRSHDAEKNRLASFNWDEKRRSFLKQVGGGAALAGFGGVTIASETVEASHDTSRFQVDLVQGTSLKDPIDKGGYSGASRLINWKWGDPAGNTAEGSLNKEPFDPGNDCSVTTGGISIDTSSDTASVTVDTGCSSDNVDLSLVCYSGPQNGQLGWEAVRSGEQQVFDFDRVQAASGSSMSLSVDIPPTKTWDFEDPIGLSDQWRTYQSFVQKGNRTFNGSNSGGIEASLGAGDLDIAEHLIPGRGSGAVDSVVFYWNESASSTGGGFGVKNDNGDWVARFASANPEWNVAQGDGTPTQIYDGSSSSTSAYDKWVKVEFNFDWTTDPSTVTYNVDEQSGNNVSKTSTQDVINEGEVSKIVPHNYNVDFTSGGDMHMWFDDIQVSGIDINRDRVDAFESGFGNFTDQETDFQQKSNQAFRGSNSVGIEADSTSDPLLADSNVSRDVDTVSAYLYETSSSTGSGIRLVNSNTENEAGFALDNPQWFIEHGNGPYEKVNAADDTGQWIYVQFDLDFGAGNFDFFIQDTQTGTTESGTKPLLNSVGVDKVELRNFNVGDNNFQATDACYAWFDDIRIS